MANSRLAGQKRGSIRVVEIAKRIWRARPTGLASDFAGRNDAARGRAVVFASR